MTEQNPQDPVTPPPSATPPPPPPETVGYSGPMTATSQDERTWGMLAHISSLAGFIIPFGNIIGPLIIWLVKKDTMPFVNDQGKESLNFQITVSIAVLICLALICVAGLGIILAPVVGIIALVFAIIGGVKASSGEAYRYPVAIRLIR